MTVKLTGYDSSIDPNPEICEDCTSCYNKQQMH
ncbi:unnamed protein product [Wuchereria bancrofti]|uniref:Uncharacterized protein n=1 Tax=Wuchereria bancrofti TaxID=6293 RepID=A0A3P7EF41_WUCBA|nr:unnamed protein product [Wuchereria bancrofti]